MTTATARAAGAVLAVDDAGRVVFHDDAARHEVGALSGDELPGLLRECVRAVGGGDDGAPRACTVTLSNGTTVVLRMLAPWPALAARLLCVRAAPPVTDEEPLRRQAACWVAAQRHLPTLLHDVRGPLNALSVNLEMAAAAAAPACADGTGAARYTPRLRESLDALHAVLERFHHALAPRPGAGADEAARVDVAGLLAVLCALLGAHAQMQGTPLRPAPPDGAVIACVAPDVARDILWLTLTGAVANAASGPIRVALDTSDRTVHLRLRFAALADAAAPADGAALTAVAASLERLGGTLSRTIDGGEVTLRLELPR